MIIEQVEALKVWLTNKLSPICDAEPSALAKYVCALVKKDKPEQDLRDICVDQLDVFLQQNTKSFVDELFEVLKSKVYIPPVNDTKPRPPPVTPAKQDVKSPSHQASKDKEDGTRKKTSEISSTTEDKENKDTSVTTATTTSSTFTLSSSKDSFSDTHTRDLKEPPREVREPRATSREGRDRERDRDGSRDRRETWREERYRDGIRDTRDGIRDTRDGVRDTRDGVRDTRDGVRDTRDGVRDARDAIRDVRDARDIIRDREKDRFDLRTDNRGGDTREVREPRDREFRDRDRDRDFRRRRTRSRSFSPRRRDFDADRRRRFDERPRFSPDRRWPRRRSWSRSPRRNRSPLDRGGRARSRSPRLRSRSPRDRFRSFRSRTKSRSPRPRSWSRPGSGSRLRTRSPSNTRQPDSRGSTPLQDNDFISSSTNDLATVTSTVGTRPLIEERLENRLPTTFDGPPPAFAPGARARCQNFEEKGFCMLGDVCPFDHGSDPVVVEDVSMPSVMPTGTTPGIPSSAGGFVPPDLRVPPPGHMAVRVNLQHPPPPHVEPYLPEAPGLGAPLRPPFLRGPPPDLRQPPPGMILNRPPRPEQFFPGRREVIINRPPLNLEERGDMHEGPGLENESSRIVIPSKRPYSAIDNDPNAINIGPPPPRMAHVNQHHHMFGAAPPQEPAPPPQIQPPVRRGFDYNRLGLRASLRPSGMRHPFRGGNVTLEVRKIPAEMNNIAKLNEHFGKFGTLTNIQVKFQGDPGAALISYSNPGEANAAYRSPEPVFNNRFIKLFWHNAEKHLNLDGETENPVVSITVGDEGREVQMQQTTVTGGRVGDGIDHPSLMLPVRPTIPPAHKLQLDNTKPKPNASPAPSAATTDTTSPTLSSPTSEKAIIYTSSVGNLKKTVFNPAASAAPGGAARPKAASPFVSPTAVKTADHVSRMEAIKRAEEERKLASVKQKELEIKRQELLSKQIQQQKMLLETLEKKKATMSEDEKKGLLKSLRAISDAIDKVKYGVGTKKPQAATMQVAGPAQFKYVSSQDQSRKEMLDLELEVMTKQSKGEDTTALRMKMQELANKTAPLAPAPAPYGRGRGWAPGRGGGWASRGRGRGMLPAVGRTHLDNRPKTIEVKGFDLSELEEIKGHFQRFGEIDRVELVEEIPSAFFTFTARPSAEMAVAQGGKFKKKTLVVRWNQITPKITRAESTQSSEVDEDLSVTLGSLDEDSLLGIGVDDKSDSSAPSVLPPSTPQESFESKNTDPAEGESSGTFPEESIDSAKNLSGTRSVSYERSLSEDLLGEEENFKASYTDDEDEEDHITVTLSNTASSGPSLYTSGDYSNISSIKAQEGDEDVEEDLSNLENSGLDYDEDGSWA